MQYPGHPRIRYLYVNEDDLINIKLLISETCHGLMAVCLRTHIRTNIRMCVEAISWPYKG